MARNITICFTLDPSYMPYIESVCKADGITQSQYMRRLIDEDFAKSYTMSVVDAKGFFEPVDSDHDDILYNKETKEFMVNGKKYKW